MVAVLLLGLSFHTEDPNGVSDTMNIFMFSDLSLIVGTEAVMVVGRWDTALEFNALTTYADTNTLMKKQRISLIVGWEGAAKMIEKCLVYLVVILSPLGLHTTVHEIIILV